MVEAPDFCGLLVWIAVAGCTQKGCWWLGIYRLNYQRDAIGNLEENANAPIVTASSQLFALCSRDDLSIGTASQAKQRQILFLAIC